LTGTSLGSFVAAAFAGLFPLQAQAHPIVAGPELTAVTLAWAKPPVPPPAPEPSPDPRSPDAGDHPQPTAGDATRPPADAASCNCALPEPRPTYVDPDPSKNIPPGYHLEGRRRNGLLIAGLTILGIGYVVPIAVTASKSEASSPYLLGSDEVPFDPVVLFLPVLGPWAAISQMPSDCSGWPYRGLDPSNCTKAQDETSIWRAALIVDGLVQLTGATLAVMGHLWPRQELVINSGLKAQVVPLRLSGSGHGLGVVGTFGGP
jgi:hypothetical protein